MLDSLFQNNHRGKPLKDKRRFEPDEHRYMYEGGVFDRSTGQLEVVVIGVASDGKTGFGDPTPDSRPFGMVTAFCENYTRCPDSVNQL